ncbi:MAG: homoserine dehydrogenase [Planctomycetota bacterium]
MDQVKVGLVGLGTIGSGVARMLLDQGKAFGRKVGVELVLAKVAELDAAKIRKAKVPARLVAKDAREIIEDPRIHVLIELIGGIHPAKEIILAALKKGKHVVTANKALLAAHGDMIFETARKMDRCVSFEASVGGGIPVIAALRDGLAANRIQTIFGIVNGTTNYILTQMTHENETYDEALAEAQKRGYAEADPTADVSGADSTHKLAILARLGFGMRVDYRKIYREGIDHIFLEDVKDALKLGYVLKLLAIGKREGDQLDLRVHPTLLPTAHPLASVNGVFNAIGITGDWVGPTMFYGRGAGREPTTSAVTSDLIDVALGRASITFRKLGCFSSDAKAAKLLDMAKVKSRYFLRINVVDKPGVLARIAGVLGRNHISIASVVQPEWRLGRTVPLVMMTHTALSGHVRRAMKQIDLLDVVKGKSRLIRVEG